MSFFPQILRAFTCTSLRRVRDSLTRKSQVWLTFSTRRSMRSISMLATLMRSWGCVLLTLRR